MGWLDDVVVGCFVGRLVGELVGKFVGSFVGMLVGWFVGWLDGIGVGPFVGSSSITMIATTSLILIANDL